ncbi:MAG: UDP-2,4-diacetamido-2,4,6-trideoxy-beta-L-altropyranose hydrolase [Proteobacteria bacterium]|nr:UDP-2,4-diacetamido-2,4,6-trideoxy-beta-L-altropyranose hydrolase [Pseudomonadota bacterium]
MIDRVAVIRADGSASIGMGHLMRCSVLSEELIARGWKVVFLSRMNDGTGLKFLQGKGYSVTSLGSEISLQQDCADTLEVIRSSGASIVVTDSYMFDLAYFKKLKKSGVVSLNIDDLAEVSQVSDFVLNQNASAKSLKYRNAEETQLLLGTQYALIRWELRGMRLRVSSIAGRARHFLISLGGGSDPNNTTGLLIQSLRQIGGVSADIVIGPGHSQRTQLESLCIDSQGQLVLHVATDKMGILMARADIMVSAGGTTSWERCCLGVPGFCIVLASDQEPNVRFLDEIGAAISLGWHHELSEEGVVGAIRSLVFDEPKRTKMRSVGMHLVDGQGVYRVLDCLEKRLAER